MSERGTIDVRVGMLRLAIVLAGLAALSLVIAIGFIAAGATARAGLAAGTGLVGVGTTMLGVAAFARTGSLAQHRARVRSHETTGPAVAESLCFGLLTLGIAFSAIALAIG